MKKFKRILCVILCLTTLLALTACGSKKKDDKDEGSKTVESEKIAENIKANIKTIHGEKNGDIEDMVINIDGKEIVLPCLFEEILALGYSFNNEFEPETLTKYERAINNISLEKNNKHEIEVSLYNPTEKDLEIKKCLVEGVLIKSENITTCGIKLGDNKETVKQLLQQYKVITVKTDNKKSDIVMVEIQEDDNQNTVNVNTEKLSFSQNASGAKIGDRTFDKVFLDVSFENDVVTKIYLYFDSES